MGRELLLLLLLLGCCLCVAGEDLGQCNGRVVLTEKEGVVVDHTTPNTNYSSEFPLICGWLIDPEDVDETKYTTIQFDYIDLVDREGRVDYIHIYDGDIDDPTLFVLTGNQIPAPIMSSGRRVFVRFNVGAPGSPTGLGFRFTYSSGICPNDCSGHGYCFADSCTCEGGFEGPDCSTPVCSDDCGGPARGKCVQNEGDMTEECECIPGYYGGDCTTPFCEGTSEFTAAMGNFSDHHKNELGNEFYEHNSYCQWLIRPPMALGDEQLQIIQLHFNTFSTELDNDFVRVYDGEDPETAQLLGEFSGEIIPSDVFSSTGVMLVTFETDIGFASEGFSCSYQVNAKTIDHVHQEHKSHDWLSAFIVSCTFVVGIALGIVAVHLYNTMKEGRGEEGDEEEGDYSRLGSENNNGLLDDDAGDLLENHSPLLEEEEEGVVGQQPIGQQPIKAEVSDLEGEDETLDLE